MRDLSRKLDLGLGNPLFLRPYWLTHYSVAEFSHSAHMTYGTHGGSPELVTAIRNLHQNLGNADITNKHIVIGYGATQILSVAAQALYISNMYIREPYYFRTPGIMEAAGIIAETNPDFALVGSDGEIVTTPSNPILQNYEPIVNGRLIYDLSYNWPTYVPVTKRDEDVMVFGMSKATGHAGNRIGWAIVKDESVAEKMNKIIEHTTGGVSRDNQERARIILNTQNAILSVNRREDDPALLNTVFEFGKNELRRRWASLLKLNVPELKILNTGGMFVWAYYTGGASAFETRFNVKVTSGLLCGGDAYHIRINVGGDEMDFNELIMRLTS